MGQFRFLTAGESHGPGLTSIVEGIPAGLPLLDDHVNEHLRRRQGGYGRGGRMKIEKDRVLFLSGIRHGKTLGSPITLYIENKDWVNWQDKMSAAPVETPQEQVTKIRPGHADFTGAIKYGFDDIRNVIERSSSRETASRVAVGAVARRLLSEFGVEIHSHVVSIGRAGYDTVREGQSNQTFTAEFWGAVEESEVRCGDPALSQQMIETIDAGKHKGDTCGGVFEVVVTGLPIGLGSYSQWDRRLGGRLAAAVMSIQAVKGMEIGGGFSVTARPGSQVHDVIHHDQNAGWQHRSNNAGGLEGGITNGEPLVVRVGIKPIPTLANPLPSADLVTKEDIKSRYERSDVCVVPAAGVVGEAMVAIALADAWLDKFGGDSLDELRRNYDGYIQQVRQH